MSTPNFWALPDFSAIRTPVTILKEQADALTKSTDGLLKGEVTSFVITPGIDGYTNGTKLLIRVPFLKDYHISIVRYFHDIGMYPGIIEATALNKKAAGAALNRALVCNEDDFSINLHKILSSEHTKMILANLISQANAEG